MTTPKAKIAGLALIAALCAGFTLGLTARAWAGWDEAVAAYQRGDYATAIRLLSLAELLYILSPVRTQRVRELRS